EECQRQGVEYVPACLQNKKKQRHREDEQAPRKGGKVWEPDSLSEDSDSGDSMSDLYPDQMFSKKSVDDENGDLQSDSDADMEVEQPVRSNQRKRPQ
ncbi:hypothetical protein GDO81_023875, partial [Engystomops pustulosus]